MKVSLRILLVSMVLLWAGFATSAALAQGRPNCLVTILDEKMNGERLRMTFQNTLKSQQECAALADLHRHTQLTEDVRQKTVDYQWLGSKTPKAVAQRKHRTRRYH